MSSLTVWLSQSTGRRALCYIHGVSETWSKGVQGKDQAYSIMHVHIDYFLHISYKLLLGISMQMI